MISRTSPVVQTGTAPASAGAVPLLTVTGVGKSFGGVHALTDVSFDVSPGSVTAVIGPNGAGKTTLFNAITGFMAPDTGSVHFHGTRIDNLPPHRVARLGVVRTFQSIKMFTGLTVFESMLTAQPSARAKAEGDPRSRAVTVLRRLDLHGVADRLCTELPLLAQRKIEVARALMTGPELIMLDEPSAGATVAERDQLADLVLELQQQGITVMVIEHNVPFVMKVSNRIVVLDFGKVVANGTPAEIADDPVVQEIYLGS